MKWVSWALASAVLVTAIHLFVISRPETPAVSQQSLESLQIETEEAFNDKPAQSSSSEKPAANNTEEPITTSRFENLDERFNTNTALEMPELLEDPSEAEVDELVKAVRENRKPSSADQEEQALKKDLKMLFSRDPASPEGEEQEEFPESNESEDDDDSDSDDSEEDDSSIDDLEAAANALDSDE